MTLQTLFQFFAVSRLQSYDNISKVVSVTYGKDAKEEKRETATNQWFMDNRP
jgi:hypothetical protein